MARENEDIDSKQALERLKEIAKQIEGKKVDLEKSLDLLEEGVRLANLCTDKINQDGWEEAVQSEDTSS